MSGLWDRGIQRDMRLFVVHVPHEVPHADNYPFDYPWRVGLAFTIDLTAGPTLTTRTTSTLS